MYRVTYTDNQGKRGHFDYHTRYTALLMLNSLILDYGFSARLRKIPRRKL